jgi:hypothetical protein
LSPNPGLASVCHTKGGELDSPPFSFSGNEKTTETAPVDFLKWQLQNPYIPLERKVKSRHADSSSFLEIKE